MTDKPVKFVALSHYHATTSMAGRLSATVLTRRSWRRKKRSTIPPPATSTTKISDHAPAKFTIIKHMAHNLLRRPTGKGSFRLRRKVAGWDDEFLASLVTAWNVHPIRLSRISLPLPLSGE